MSRAALYQAVITKCEASIAKATRLGKTPNVAIVAGLKEAQANLAAISDCSSAAVELPVAASAPVIEVQTPVPTPVEATNDVTDIETWEAKATAMADLARSTRAVLERMRKKGKDMSSAIALAAQAEAQRMDTQVSLLVSKINKFKQTCGARVCVIPLDPIMGCVSEPLEIAVPALPVEHFVEAKEDHEGWVEKATRYLGNPATVMVAQPTVEVAAASVEYRATFDAHRSIGLVDANPQMLGERINNLVKMPTTAFTGKIIGSFVEPTTSRGNPKGKPQPVYRFGTSNALVFEGDGPEEMCTFATRYAVPKRGTILTPEAETLARTIAQDFFRDAFDPLLVEEAMNECLVGKVHQSWMAKARSAGYASAHNLTIECDDRIVRFHPKVNVKAVEDIINIDKATKAPQGISAWSKGANTFFGYGCRVISAVMRQSLRPEYTWDNGYTPEEAAARYVLAMKAVPVSENVTMDVSEMDSKQNPFTHELNKQLDLCFGWDREFIELYYSMLDEYRLVAKTCEAIQRGTMPSGMPWTLKNNSFLEMMMQNYIVRGTGPKAVYGKGDDCNRCQAGLYLDIIRAGHIRQFCDFEMVFDFSEKAAFCGYVLSDGVLCPNLRRKLIKLVASGYATEDHFTQMQISLRDYVNGLVGHDNLSMILDVNATTYNVDTHVVLGWLDIISSVSHISWEQFVEVASLVERNTLYTRPPDNIDPKGSLVSLY